MPRYKITTGDGQSFVVTAPEGVPEDKILETVRQSASQLGMYDMPKPEAPAEPEKTGLLGAAKQLFTDPAGFQKQNVAAKEKLQNPVVGAVEGALPSAMTAATLPLTGIGGQLAAKALPTIPKLAAIGGEALVQGALGAGQAAIEGYNPLHVGAMDAVTSAVTGGLMSLIPAKKLLGLSKPIKELIEDFGDRQKAYAYATDSIKSAFDKVHAAFPAARWMQVPAIDSTKRLTAKEVEAGLHKLHGVDFEVARQQIINELNRLDLRNLPAKMRQGAPKSPAPYMGTEFEKRLHPYRVKPTMKPEERTAERASSVLNAIRPVAETAMTRSPEGTGGTPFGALAANAMVQGSPLRHIPGARMLRDVVGDEATE